MKNYNLQQFLLPLKISAPDISFNRLETDSRNVRPGNLFLAILGEINDGRNYISEAIKNGAVAVIAEKKNLITAIIYKIKIALSQLSM
ncbi:Mur ligase domain-containing protein [Candidatus Tachikawaea gelatinosa]|uniref:Mur ligase domain-containing protein n=1 Tax=Candidatus Tachikawaea gelatinosa TaxID=1410383 RepID=UPI0006936C50|nr:Mur ligase domain-containing protein [Candidatus Tachikawaea gelatinosa]